MSPRRPLTDEILFHQSQFRAALDNCKFTIAAAHAAILGELRASLTSQVMADMARGPEDAPEAPSDTLLDQPAYEVLAARYGESPKLRTAINRLDIDRPSSRPMTLRELLVFSHDEFCHTPLNGPVGYRIVCEALALYGLSLKGSPR